MAADRAEHVTLVRRAGARRGRVGGHRPLLGVDPRLPGLRPRPRPRRTCRAGGLGRRRPGGRPVDPGRRRRRRGRGPARRLRRARAPTGWSSSVPSSRRVSAQGFLAQAAADPEHWLVVDGTAEVAALTAHIVASVRERLGDAPAGAAGERGAARPASSSPAWWARRTPWPPCGRRRSTPCTPTSSAAPPATAAWPPPTGSPPRCCAPTAGAATCATCRAALAGTDPDLHVVRRSGASISIAEIRQVVSLAQRRPLHAARQVIVLLDVHLAALRAPALLKTLEEPPGDTVFVLLTDEVLARAGDGGQPLGRDRVPAGAARGPGALAHRLGGAARHGRRGGGQQRWQSRAGAHHRRRPRRGGAGGAVGIGARRAGRVGHDGRRADAARARVGRPLRRAAAGGARAGDRDADRGGQGDGRAGAAGAQGDRRSSTSARSGASAPMPCGRAWASLPAPTAGRSPRRRPAAPWRWATRRCAAPSPRSG